MADVTYLVTVPSRSGMGTVSFTAPDDLNADALRERARQALLARMGAAHDFSDNVEYQIYRDGYNGGTVNGTAEARERLGISNTGTVVSWNGTNSMRRWTANIRPTSDYPTVRGMVVGSDGSPLTRAGGRELPDDVKSALRRLDFRSDGVAGRTREESLRYVREFERIFRGRTFHFAGPPPADVPGEELMRQVIAEGRANMGPSEGTDSLAAIYNEAGIDSSASGRTDADFARLLGEAPAGLSGDSPSATPDSVIDSYLANPSAENLQRLRADRAATDRLIQRLLAALEGGNLDVLMPLMDCVARVSNMTVAEIGARTARLLGASDQQAGEIGRRLQDLNTSSTDPAARARANQDLQGMQLQLQQNTQARQQIMGMLQSTMEMSRSIGDANKELRQANLARQRANLAG